MMKRILFLINVKFRQNESCRVKTLIRLICHGTVKGQLISKCLFGAIVSTKKPTKFFLRISALAQRYTYRVLQTIQMKLILLFVWAEPAVLGSTKTDSKLR